MKDKAVMQLMNKLVMNKRTRSRVYVREPHKPPSKLSLIRHMEFFNAVPMQIKMAKISSIKRRFKKERIKFTEKN